MLKQCHQRCWLKILRPGFQKQIQKGPGSGFDERPPGRVIDAKTPLLEPDCDPTRKNAVRGDERCGLSRCLNGLTQDECYRFGFGLGGRGFKIGRAGQAVGNVSGCHAGDVVVPLIGCTGGTHRFGDEPAADGRAVVGDE